MMQALKPKKKHGAILLFEDILPNLDHIIRPQAQ